jgi:hypothetical protein
LTSELTIVSELQAGFAFFFCGPRLALEDELEAPSLGSIGHD